MRVARQLSDHTRLSHVIDANPLQPREPALIHLPIPLPSIPVISSLISPIISGNNNGGKGNGNNGNGNGNNGNGNGNGNNDTPTTTKAIPPTPNPTPTSAAATVPTSNAGGTGTGTSSGGSTSGGSSSSGGTDGGGSTTPGSTGSDSTPGGSDSSGGDQTGSDTPSGDSDVGTVSEKPAIPGSSLQSGDGAGLTSSSSSGVEGPVANAGQLPDAQVSGKGNSTPSRTSGSFSPGSTDGTSPGSSPNSPISRGGAESGKGISTQAVVAIAVVCSLLLLLVLVLFLRRRRVARRHERMNRWWSTKNRTSQTYDDEKAAAILPSGPLSTRSSFATTVDHSLNPQSQLDFSGILPALPPMAELRAEQPFAPGFVIQNNNTGNVMPGDHRFSSGSIVSQDSQFLVVHHRDSLETSEFETPMSARPFLPANLFAFPRPPSEFTADYASAHSRAVSLSSGTAKFPASDSPIPDIPTVAQVTTTPTNPFADISDEDPFADGAQFSPYVPGEFAEIETIRRLFVPTLVDELGVSPGDEIKIVKLFDDGWAFAEKISTGGVERGLFPIDCLREPGQDLSTFMRVKRVSSYVGEEFMAV